MLYYYSMFGRAKAKWLLFTVIGLVIVAGLAVLGFGLFSKKTDSSALQAKGTPILNACQYLTNEEAGALLGQMSKMAPVNSDSSGAKDIQASACEYNQGMPDTLIVHIAKGLTPEAIINEHDAAGQPIDQTLEEPYTMLGRNGFISKERIGEDGVHMLASARFLTKDGSVQINADTFEVVEKAMITILPKVDDGQ